MLTTYASACIYGLFMNTLMKCIDFKQKAGNKYYSSTYITLFNEFFEVLKQAIDSIIAKIFNS